MTDAREHGLRILIVDDFPDVAAVTQMLLESYGHETRVATTGREALAIAQDFDPELAILDIGLPDLSGFEIARVLRSRVTGHRLYLAAVTGWGDHDTREKAFNAGFDEHVVKPTDAGRLKQIVRSASLALAS